MPVYIKDIIYDSNRILILHSESELTEFLILRKVSKNEPKPELCLTCSLAGIDCNIRWTTSRFGSLCKLAKYRPKSFKHYNFKSIDSLSLILSSYVHSHKYK